MVDSATRNTGGATVLHHVNQRANWGLQKSGATRNTPLSELHYCTPPLETPPERCGYAALRPALGERSCTNSSVRWCNTLCADAPCCTALSMIQEPPNPATQPIEMPADEDLADLPE